MMKNPLHHGTIRRNRISSLGTAMMSIAMLAWFSWQRSEGFSIVLTNRQSSFQNRHRAIYSHLHVHAMTATSQDSILDERLGFDEDDRIISDRTVEPTISAVDTDDDDNDDEESVIQFLEMVKMIPSGELEQEEATLLREIVASASNENHVTEKSNIIMENLLFRMVDEWLTTKSLAVEPSVRDFASAMRAWEQLATIEAESNNKIKRNTNSLPTAVKHVKDLFYALENLYKQTGYSNIRPNKEIFQIVLRVMAMSREPGLDRKAMHIFERMSKYDLEPDPYTYESMIILLAKSRQRNAANRAERMLREAVERYPPSSSNSSVAEEGMGIQGFNAVITAWAKSGMEYGPERAENLIKLMDQIGIPPSMVSLTSLIDAYAQLNSWDGIGQSERILNRIIDLYLDGDESFQPSIVTWTVVMSAWCRLARKGFKGAAARADRLLRRLETLHKEGRMNFGPDAIAYITVMNANAFSKTVEGLTRATEILDEMNERWLDGEESFKPSPRSIRLIVDFWVKNSAEDRMNHAEDILERYAEHIDPDELSEEKARMDLSEIHKSMIFGYCQTGEPDLAQSHLQQLIENNLDIDTISLCWIIDANTQSNDKDALKRSIQVFDLMEKCRLQHRIVPNERVYTSFIKAMTKARTPNLSMKAQTVLKRMDEIYSETGNQDMKPSIFTFNAAIFACSETATDASEEERKEALKIAVSIFNEIRRLSKGGDHVTFGNMIRCAHLLQEGEKKDQFLRSIFQECCKQGLVSEFVLRDFKELASEELVQSFFDGSLKDDIDVERLPHAWKQNVGPPKRSLS